MDYEKKTKTEAYLKSITAKPVMKNQLKYKTSWIQHKDKKKRIILLIKNTIHVHQETGEDLQ
jgi:hypothetical protein